MKASDPHMMDDGGDGGDQVARLKYLHLEETLLQEEEASQASLKMVTAPRCQEKEALSGL